MTDVAKTSAPPTRPRSGLAWCGLLLSLAALTLGGWLHYAGQQEAARAAAQFENAGRANRANEAETRRIASRLRRTENSLLEKLATERADLEREREEQIQALHARLENQRQRLLELGGGSRTRWALAEAEHLARLANQRLLMGGDVDAALVAAHAVQDGPVLELAHQRRLREDVAPRLPGGTMIVVTAWHDNSTGNQENPTRASGSATARAPSTRWPTRGST